jgi:hypothetical protein
MGIDIKLVTADEAYHDKDGSLFKETGILVTMPPSSKASLPENIDGDRKQAHDIRKNCERPFNLLKNQTGLETI